MARFIILPPILYAMTVLCVHIQAQSITSISEIYNGGNGEEFTIKGIVTTPEFGNESGTLFFIQDETAGVLANFVGHACVTTQGDSSIISGTKNIQNGNVELLVSALERTSSGNELPNHQLLSNSDIEIGSGFIGSRVTIADVLLEVYTDWPSESQTEEALISANSGTTNFAVRIDVGSFFNGKSAPCGRFDISGILTQTDNVVQIMPFYEDEIIENTLAQLSLSEEEVLFEITEVGFASVDTVLVNGSELYHEIEVGANGDFLVSLDGTSYVDLVTIPNPSGTITDLPVFIKFQPSTGGLKEETLLINTCGILIEKLLSGEALGPEIVLNRSMISFPSTEIGVIANLDSFTVSGTFLSEDIIINVSGNDFMISDEKASGFGKEIALNIDDDEVAITRLYVQFTPSSEGNIDGSISFSSSGVTESIALAGIGLIPPDPSILLSTDLISFDEVEVNTVSDPMEFTVEGTDLDEDITLLVSEDFQLSLDNESYDNSIVLAKESGNILETIIFVQFNPTTAEEKTGTIELSSTGLTLSISLQGIGVQPLNPEISIDVSSLSFEETSIGFHSEIVPISFSASELSENMSIEVTGEFEISLEENTNFSNLIIIQPVSGEISSTQIFVRFSPISIGEKEGSISFKSSEVSTIASLNGSAVEPVPTIILDKNTISFGTFKIDETIDPLTFSIEAFNLEDNLFVEVFDEFEISDALDGDYSQTLELPVTNGELESTELAIRIVPTSTGEKNGQVVISSSGQEEVIELFADVSPPDPQITFNRPNLSFSNTEVGQISANVSFDIEAVFLTSELQLSVPDEFEISLNGTSDFQKMLVISPIDGTVEMAEVFVRFVPQNVGEKSENLNIQSSGISESISLSALALEPPLSFEEQTLNTYPNPFTDKIAIQGLETKLIIYSFVDASGKVILSGNGVVRELQMELDRKVPFMSKGVYFLNLSIDGKIQRHKMIKN